MSEIKEYKCPSCGGPLTFDSSIQKLKCPHCDNEINVEALIDELETEGFINSKDSMSNWSTTTNNSWESESSNLKTYICDSCGGEIIADATTGATKCPFCDNPVVIKDKFANDLKPDLIIPFQLDKQAAKESLLKHLTGKKLLPSLFKDENHIDEVKGVYVPFMLCDANVSGGVKYKGTNVRHWSTGKYRYTEISYYSIFRQGDVSFKNIPVDAASQINDELMDSLEPFDFSKAVKYNSGYFPGYLATIKDVDMVDLIPRINIRVKNSTAESFRDTISNRYESIQVENSTMNLNQGDVKYALLPVWLLNTTYKGEKYTFAMNGQTGKFVGNLPCDKSLAIKYWFKTFLITTLITLAAGLALVYFVL